MKLSKIKKLCNDDRMLYLTDQKDPVTGEIIQYLGDSTSMYPLRGLPYMDKDNLLAVMDIPEGDRPKWNVTHAKEFPQWISTEDVGADIELKRLACGIFYNVDYIFYEMGHSGMLIAVDSRYTGPLEGDYSLVWRFLSEEDKQADNDPKTLTAGYIVVKRGFFFEALFMNTDLPDIARKEIKKIAERI